MNINDFTNIAYLARKLAAREISGWYSVSFLLAENILYVIFSFVAYYLLKIGYSNNAVNVAIEDLIIVLVTIFGIRSCYKIYSDSDFIVAFIVLSLPSLVYSTLLNWIINITIVHAVDMYGESVEFDTESEVIRSMDRASHVLEYGSIIASVISLIIFYYLIRTGFKIINTTKINKS